MPHFDVMMTYCYNGGLNVSEKFSDMLQIYNRIWIVRMKAICLHRLPSLAL